jgi:5'-nucleotidase
VVYSGTVGAAMTASFLGLPALALSQTFRSRTEIHWEVAAHWTPILLRDLAAGGWPGGACYTVNFPDVTLAEVSGIRASRQGRDAVLQVEVEAREDMRAVPYFWLSFQRRHREHEPGTDVDALRCKAIAVTPLRFDRTADAALAPLQERLDRLMQG